MNARPASMRVVEVRGNALGPVGVLSSMNAPDVLRRVRLRGLRPASAAALLATLPLLGAAPAARAEDVATTIVEAAVVRYDPERSDAAVVSEAAPTPGVRTGGRGQWVEATVDLPEWPADPALMRRLVLGVEVEPIERDGRPVDPWTRLGRVQLLPRTPASDTGEGGPVPLPLELMRFITGFGTAGRFEQDVTSFGPALAGRTTIRVSLSTFAREDAWRIRVTLVASEAGIGVRRPRFVRPLVEMPLVTNDADTMSAVVVVPSGMEAPRVRIVSTGHATDGRGAHEFESATHIVRVDGIEVARFRPWREDGGTLREANLWAGRQTVEGREVWSSDLDRSGWVPGRVVDPLVLPLPELTPGRHRVEVQVVGIRPPDAEGARGFWVLSMALVADERWE